MRAVRIGLDHELHQGVISPINVQIGVPEALDVALVRAAAKERVRLESKFSRKKAQAVLARWRLREESEKEGRNILKEG